VDDFLYCKQRQACPSVLGEQIIYFCRAVGIEGFGDRIVRELVARGLVKELADLFRLKESDLMPIERMGQVLAKKLIEHVKHASKMEPALFLTALGIEEVGPTVSELLMTHFESLEALMSADEEDLQSIHGIGPSIAESLVESLKIRKHEIGHLLRYISLEKMAKTMSRGPLLGQSFLFTGTLESMDRKEAQKQVRALGGHTPSSVTRDLSYLVVGPDEKNSSKIKKANTLIENGASLRILDEQEFLRLIEQK
jgi:DNA ligase (NAD+)